MAMKLATWTLATLAVAAGCVTPAAWTATPPATLPSSSAGPSENDIRRDATVRAVESVMPAVVNISTETVVTSRGSIDELFREFFDPYYREREAESGYSVGSGVIIDEDGHILTNHHVVSRAHRITVKLMDGTEFEAKPLTGAAFTDIALLRIVTPGKRSFSHVKFAADDDLLLGESVIALGNPFGLGGSVSRGILSSKARRPPNKDEPLDIPDWLQIDAAINPGNSGGPLINLKGELIGINVAVSRQGQGIGFAIPIKRISSTLSDMISPEVFGGFWFGARLRPQQTPPRILDVEEGSPAALAGLKAGDMVVNVDSQPVRTTFELVDVLRKAGEKRTIAIGFQLGLEPGSARLRLVREQPYFNADLVRSRLGIQVEQLSAAAAARIGLDLEGGLLIQGIDPGSAAAETDLKRGMFISAIDGQPTLKVGRAAKLLHAKERGKAVQMQLTIPYRRGRFIEVRQGTIDLVVR
ncbi:MAG: PDZ domain-containing protein [Verrucomicrobia bacterium]|nr:PDZ domain-containing protein [Verrucomicrobiota bacterium]